MRIGEGRVVFLQIDHRRCGRQLHGIPKNLGTARLGARGKRLPLVCHSFQKQSLKELPAAKMRCACFASAAVNAALHLAQGHRWRGLPF